MNALHLLLVCLAGWMNRHQQLVIEYLQERDLTAEHAAERLRETASAEPRE